MRIQFDLSEDKAHELDTFMERIGVSTKKDLFENSLTFLEWAVDEIYKNPNRVIGSIDESSDTYKELQMSVFSTARSKARAKLNKTCSTASV